MRLPGMQVEWIALACHGFEPLNRRAACPDMDPGSGSVSADFLVFHVFPCFYKFFSNFTRFSENKTNRKVKKNREYISLF